MGETVVYKIFNAGFTNVFYTPSVLKVIIFEYFFQTRTENVGKTRKRSPRFTKNKTTDQ